MGKKKKKKTPSPSRTPLPSAAVPESASAAAPDSVSAPSAWWRRREYLVMALVAILCLVAFGRNVTFTAIPVDLPQMVFENPRIITGLTWENIYWAFTEPNLALYQPLPNISFMIDSHLFGQWPGGYHTVTLLWHIACTWVFFWVTLRLLKNFPVALMATLLMAVQPVQLSVVSQIGSRNEAMQAFFMLLSIDAYRRYAAERSRSAYWYSLLFMILGLMCKQIIVVLPVVFLLLDYWPLRRIEISFREFRTTFRAATKLTLEKAPFFALAFLGAFLAVYGKMQYGQIRYHVMRLTIPDAIYFVITGYARYVGHLVLPVRMAYFEAYAEEQYLWFFILSVITLTVISATALLLMRKHPYLIVGWLWFVVLLFPVSGVVRYMLESIAIRYLYASAMGLYIAVSFALYEFACWFTYGRDVPTCDSDRQEKQGAGMPKWYWATVSIVTLILAVLTFWQNEYLRDMEAAVERMIKRTGGRSSFGHSVLATMKMREGKTEEAEEHFQKAIEIQPYTYMFRYFYAAAMYPQERFQRVVEVMKPAVEADPDNPDFLSLYAMGLMGMGLYRPAEEHFKRSLSIRPTDVPTIHNLAYCLILQRRFDEARPLINLLLEHDPTDPIVNELAQIVGREAIGPIN